MKFASQDVLDLIPKLYDGILDPGGLAEAGEALVRLGGGHTGALINRTTSMRVSVFSEMSYNVDLGSAKAYTENFATLSPCYQDEWLARPGDVLTATNRILSDQYRKSVYYNEWAHKRDHWDYVGIILSRDDSALNYYAILRPHRAGFVTELEIERVRSIAPHLRRAYMASSLILKYKAQAESLGDLIASAGFGVVLATATRQIVFANEAAETMMRARCGLCCAHRRIGAVDPSLDKSLEALVLAAAKPDGKTMPGGSIPLVDHDGAVSHVVHVVPLSASSTIRLLDQERPAVGLFIVDLRRETTFDRIRSFALLYRLTPGESRLLAELVSGEGLVEAAERIHVSEGTARTHLKHIFAKTDTHRQAELLRLFFEVTIPWTARVPGVPHSRVA